MPVPSQEIERSCICVFGVSNVPLILLLFNWILGLFGSIVCLSLVTAISCFQMMTTNLIETSDNDCHKAQALDQNCTKLRDKNYATAK